VADVFDAITSPRDYPKYVGGELFNNDPMPFPKVISVLNNGKGSQFDSDVVGAFVKIMPLAIRRYRGSHFSPEYADEALHLLLKTS
jgi:HD-GYP domain-containing protein (c-di-GMP phosphodiesterase class II)